MTSMSLSDSLEINLSKMSKSLSVYPAERLFCARWRRKSFEYLAIPILFVTFVASFSWMAGREMLAAKSGDWQYLFRIRRLLRFASDTLKLRNFQMAFRGKWKWTPTITCIYTRHKCALSYRKGVPCATYIYAMLA